jgi:hypothetical protein
VIRNYILPSTLTRGGSTAQWDVCLAFPNARGLVRWGDAKEGEFRFAEQLPSMHVIAVDLDN